MGILDSIKNIMAIPEDEDEFEEFEEEIEEPKRRPAPEPVQQKKEAAHPRILGNNKSKGAPLNFNQMQVVLVKPERFEDVTSIADNLNDRKTVVLNLESCDRESSRRIIDFLSGVAYANHGNMRKIAVSTFIIVPTDVAVSGELMLEEFDERSLYF
jgi:cell division inhibitor SepF